MGIDNKFISKMISRSARYLTCGEDLILVAKDGREYFEIGTRILNFQILDLEQLRDYVFALQAHVGELPLNQQTLAKVAQFSTWLVSAAINDANNGDVDVYLAGEFLITGDLDNDSRVLAAHIDALVAAIDKW